MQVLKHLIIFASYGNDSIALIQWIHEQPKSSPLKKAKRVTVLYSDTGWAIPWWRARVKKVEAWVTALGFEAVQTKAMGFDSLVRSKKVFPRSGMQFCTEELKIRPAIAWMEINDPNKEATCLVGVRREESKKREAFDEWMPASPAHGGRGLYAPLVDVVEVDRDALIIRAGFKVLPHRSKECFPCVNANRNDIVMLNKYPNKVNQIEELEETIGKGRTMFKVDQHMGAVGIREILKWANSPRGKYEPPEEDAGNCDGGFCGT